MATELQQLLVMNEYNYIELLATELQRLLVMNEYNYIELLATELQQLLVLNECLAVSYQAAATRDTNYILYYCIYEYISNY